MAFDPLIIFSSLLSISGVISLVVNVIITTLAIMIVDKLVAHEIEPKHSFIMAFIAYLIVPLLTGFVISFVPVIAMIGIVLPLIAWIILGEVLLKAGMKQKAIIAVIAFVLNMLLLSYVTGFILGLLPF